MSEPTKYYVELSVLVEARSEKQAEAVVERSFICHGVRDASVVAVEILDVFARSVTPDRAEPRRTNE